MNKLIYILLLSFICSCSYNPPELTFFSNMSKYTPFETVSDKVLLRGMDSTIIIQNSKNEYFLSTPGNALFNIEGKIFLKDSIVYIRTKYLEDNDSTYILFNFKPSDPKELELYRLQSGFIGSISIEHEVFYSRNGIPYAMYTENQGSYYEEEIDDYIIPFRIVKSDERYGDLGTVFYLSLSLKWGIVQLVYWRYEEDYIYAIDMPSQTIKKHRANWIEGPLPPRSAEAEKK